MDKGAFIMPRVHGSTTDINPEGTRAVTKMKATVTQRFAGRDCASGGLREADAERDCRFIFFWQKETEGEMAGEWRAMLGRQYLEKGQRICLHPPGVAATDEGPLKGGPAGYGKLA